MMNTNFIWRSDQVARFMQREKSKSIDQRKEENKKRVEVYSKKYTWNADTIAHLLHMLSKNERFIDNGIFGYSQTLFLDEATKRAVEKLWYSIGALSELHSGDCTSEFWSIEYFPTMLWAYPLWWYTPQTRSTYGYFSLDDRLIRRLNVLPEGQKVIDDLYNLVTIANHDWIHDKTLGNFTQDIRHNFVRLPKNWQLLNTTWIHNYEFSMLQAHYYVFQELYKLYPHLKQIVVDQWSAYNKSIDELRIPWHAKKHLISVYLYFLIRIVHIKDLPWAVAHVAVAEHEMHDVSPLFKKNGLMSILCCFLVCCKVVLYKLTEILTIHSSMHGYMWFHPAKYSSI